MSKPLLESLDLRLGELAGLVALGRYADVIPAGIAVACELIEAGVDGAPVVDVASLDNRATWRDAGEVVRSMLDYLAIPTPANDSDDARWPLILRAFGSWGLPISDFYGPFLSRLPAWDEQDDLERSLNLLLDDLDHASDVQAKELVVARMREVVRNALS